MWQDAFADYLVENCLEDTFCECLAVSCLALFCHDAHHAFGHTYLPTYLHKYNVPTYLHKYNQTGA